MDGKNKQLSLLERWEMDIQLYKNGSKVLTETPQCKSCANFIKGDALHCKEFMEEKNRKM